MGRSSPVTPPIDPAQFKRLLKRAVFPPLLLLAAFAAVLLWQISSLLTAYRSVDHSDQVIARVNVLSEVLLGMQNGLRGYALTGQPEMADPIERGERSVDQAYAQLRAIVSDNNVQSTRIEALRPTLDKWQAHTAQVRAMGSYGETDPEISSDEGKRLMESLQAGLSGVRSEETSLRDTRSLVIQRAAIRTVAVAIGLAAILGMVLATLAKRQLVSMADSYGAALAEVEHRAAEHEKSETLLRLTTDSLPVFISYIDSSQRYVFHNKAYEEHFDLDGNQINGSTIRQLMGDEAYQATRPHIETALTGQPVTYQRQYSFKHGETRDLEVNYVPHHGGGGKVLGLVALITDVTDRNLAQRELARSEERYRTFIRQSSEGIWRFELDQPIAISAAIDDQIDQLYRHAFLAECNDAMARMYGLDRADQIIGARLGDLMVRDDPGNLAYLRAFIHSGYRMSEGESTELDALGNPRYFVNHLVGIIDRGFLIRGWGTQRDVTDHRRFEQERDALLTSERSARTEAERAGRIKDEFLSTLSHELRTPLTAILGWAQLLRRTDAQGSDLQQGLETIERNSRSQAQIIDDLLDMSRIIAGKIRLEMQRMDLADVVDASLDTVRPAADAKGVILRKRLTPAGGAPIMGDPERLQQVVWNLLTNAIKFTPRGGYVEVALSRTGTHAVLSVTDSGIGITPDFLPYVFDRFRQADSSTSRVHGGLGLGLAIVRQMAEMHGGTAHAKSDGAGKGACFRIELPLTVDAVAEDTPLAEAPAPTRQNTAAELSGVKVLVVDDEPDARELIRRLLVDCHAEVDTADSADQAMERLVSTRPHVLVSDIGMPDRDGYWLIQQIRLAEVNGTARTPAVALTALARPEDRLRAIQAGFQMHLSKPVEPAELVAIIASLAGR